MSKPPIRNQDRKQVAAPVVDQQNDAIIGQALQWSLAVILVLMIFAALVAFWLLRPVQDVQVAEVKTIPAKPRQRPQAQSPTVTFVDITTEAGIDFTHENGAYGEKLLPETMGGGCAFLDFDGDDDQDLLLVNSSRWEWDHRQQTDPATMAPFGFTCRAT